MEKIEGTSLSGPQFVEMQVFRRVREVVGELHEFGFAHGNLRPDNILITDGSEPVLIDFETCCRRSSPMFALIKFSDHVRLVRPGSTGISQACDARNVLYHADK